MAGPGDVPESSQSPATKTDPPESGTRLGRYLVLDPLGRGGMGTVVEAYDPSLDRKIAIKVLHQAGHDRELRLLREAQALARLSHPNVVQIYEVGEVDGRLFIAMEMIQGETLSRWHGSRRPWRDVVQTYVQAGQGLAAAHAEGLVHRDFKPGNCIIDAAGRVRVLDFGLARDTGRDDSDDPDSTRSALRELEVRVGEQGSHSDSNHALEEALTRTGAMVGTLGYMAPEQLRGQPVDAKTDQFSFCVSLYEGLYGLRPFPDQSVGQLVDSVLRGAPRMPPSDTAVPGRVWAVLRRGLALDPGQRWSSLDALLSQLDRQLRRRRRRWVTASVGVGAATVLGVWLGRADVPQPCRGATERMQEVWNDTRAQAAHDAMLATGLPYATSAWTHAKSSLDDYADRWVAAHTAACEATSVHHEQSAALLDTRMQCLDERRAALRRTVALLEAADATVVEKAIPLLEGLPGLSRCDDVGALRAAVPLPEDPETAQQVRAAREQLAEVRTLLLAGHEEEAAPVVETLMTQAESLGYPPLTAAIQVERSEVRTHQGQLDAAEHDLVTAYETAIAADDVWTAMAAAERLSFLVGLTRAEPAAGRAWGITAEALAHREDPGGIAEARALRSYAVVLASSGNLDEAIPRFERVLAIHEARSGPDSIGVATTLGDMGNVYTMQQQPQAALKVYQRAREINESEYGTEHPTLVTSSLSVANALLAADDLPAALVENERGLLMAEHVYPSDHPIVALAANNVGVILDKLGRPAEALEHHHRAIAIRERVLGPSHPFTAESSSNIGMAMRAQGDHEGALPYFQRATEIFSELDHPHLPEALDALGGALLSAGRLEQARVHRLRQLKLLEPEIGSRPDLVASAELALATVLWAQGTERPRAIALAERAVEHFAAAGSRSEQDRRAAEQWLRQHPLPSD